MRNEMLRRAIKVSLAGFGTIILACGLYSAWSLVEDIRYDHYYQGGGEYVAPFTKKPQTLQYFDRGWQTVPDGIYLLAETPAMPEGSHVPPISIVTEAYGSLVYYPLDLQKPGGFSEAFHGSHFEYTWSEAEKQDSTIPPYYLLYVQNGYGEIVKSYDYPDAWYEAYRSIRSGNFRLRDRLLYDYLAPTLLSPPKKKGNTTHED